MNCRLKSRRMLESANIEFVAIFERNLRFLGDSFVIRISVYSQLVKYSGAAMAALR